MIAILAGAATLAADQATLTSGIDLTSIDWSVRPQDNLYRFVNGGWLDRTEIPPEHVVYGASTELVGRVEARLRTLIEDLRAAGPHRQGSPAQQITDLYASMLDVDGIEARGVEPIARELAAIEAIASPRDLATVVGRLASIGAAGAFGATLSVDPTDPRYPMVYLSQGGIMLPDRDYYLRDDPVYVRAREEYKSYLTTLFTYVGREDPAGDARRVLALETSLARAHWPHADAHDATRTYHRFTLADLNRTMPGFDWQAWARPQNINRSPAVLVGQPSFFEAFARLAGEEPIETWRAWLAARYITASAPYISHRFGDARFDFFGRALSGQQEPRERWRRGVSLVNAYLGEAVGRFYVERYFPKSSKTRVERIVDNLLEAYERALDDVDWMTAATRAEARRKLAVLRTKIGYPARWRDYRGLDIEADDLLGNLERAKRFENDYRLRWLGRPTSPGGWLMPPQTVNAYYSPGMNEVVFPAAILQAPFFNPDADDAINYGAIGAVIGHEIGHAFIGKGREYDSNGRLRDWWTERDDREYQVRADRLIEQAARFEPVAGVRLNGALTVGENLGDLAGLAIAYRAYEISLDGRAAPVLDGFTGPQRFFIGWAQIWRSKEREAFLRQFVLSNPHPPSVYRANAPLSHLSAFYAAFDVRPGDRLHRNAEKRVKIW